MLNLIDSYLPLFSRSLFISLTSPADFIHSHLISTEFSCITILLKFHLLNDIIDKTIQSCR